MMNRRILLIFALLIFSLKAGYAADEQPEAGEPSRAKRKFGVMAGLLGPGGLYTISADYYFIPNLALEAGGAIYPGFPEAGMNIYTASLGGKYAILGHRPGQRWSPYIGAYLWMGLVNGNMNFSNGYQLSQERVTIPVFTAYIPVGIELVAFNGFTFAFELAYIPAARQSYTVKSSTISGASAQVETNINSTVWAALKFGYHF